jgi:hypothetical protein
VSNVEYSILLAQILKTFENLCHAAHKVWVRFFDGIEE